MVFKRYSRRLVALLKKAYAQIPIENPTACPGLTINVQLEFNQYHRIQSIVGYSRMMVPRGMKHSTPVPEIRI